MKCSNKRMNKKELYQKIELLKAGQIVEINSDFFKAVRIEDEDIRPCVDICDLDCICKGDVAEICDELDWNSKTRWYLKLARRNG